jgi:hypothetical protein
MAKTVARFAPRRAAIEAKAKPGSSVKLMGPWWSTQGAAAPKAVVAIRSCTQTLPLRINEMCADHFNLMIEVGQWANESQDFAHPAIP